MKFQVSNNGGVYFNDYCNWKKIPEFQEYIYNSPAAELAGNLMHSEVTLLNSYVLSVCCETQCVAS
jgi:ectoine hydroxylase-related dioxygenase (phytanoyl-CoA dioxygenase family)